MRQRRFASLVVVVLILALSPMAVAARDTTAFPGAEGRIVYVDFPTPNEPVIASMAKDGTDRRQLTTTAQSPNGDSSPVWSPGGKFIVFTRYASIGSYGEIWRMNADGTGQKQLTNNELEDGSPGWSADGSRIVFVSERVGNYNSEIYTMDLNGGSVKRLTTNPANDSTPRWSPDNRRVAFASDRRGTLEIHTMNADGSGVTRETDALTTGVEHLWPDWSPDGQRLTFTRYDSDFDTDILIVDLATNLVTPVATSDVSESSSVFSPDVTANRVIYDYWDYDAGTQDVVLWDGDVTTSPTTNLTEDHTGNQAQPDWQPIPAFPLVDARFSTFKADIEWVFAEGITVGCSAERYCPNDTVTRGQMATFLVRALDLPPTTTDYFTDDETSSHEGNINRVRAAGITSGCGPTTYCPLAVVTREQMATFLAKGFALPSTTTDYFTDDETSSHESAINRVKAAGITSGCTPTTYCPTAVVTRGQMAAFLRRALD